ncbi:hypothetical protein FNH43_21655 [Salmonella enterica subsp. salamae]|nr:hypothetical protein [Salmonella enterica subsp. salamae]
MNIYFCQFFFSGFFIFKYCFRGEFVYANQTSWISGGKGIFWRNRGHNLKNLFISCYPETV